MGNGGTIGDREEADQGKHQVVNELNRDSSSIQADADFLLSGGNLMTFPRWFGGTHFALLRNLSGT